MHRDVKHYNILIDPETRILKLIDWGLADFYNKEGMTINVQSKYYKGPEILVKMNRYDYSVDIWALGSVFATMIFQKDDHWFRRRYKGEIEIAD